MKVISALKNKYNLISDPIKATLWFTLCSFLQKGISMITTPIFTRLLTTAEYGTYSVYQSWYNILSIIITLSIATGVFNNGMIKYEKNRDQYISSVQGLATVSTIFFSVIYFIAKDIWNGLFELSTFFILLIFIECFFQVPFLFWSARQRFEYKYKRLAIITVMMSVASPILGIIAVMMTSHRAEARVVSFVCVQVIIGAYFYIYNLHKGKCFYNREYWKFTLSLALPLIPHYLSLQLLQQSDRIMISKLSGFDKAAMYSVAYSISTLMMLLINAINASFVPYTYQNLKAGNLKKISDNANFLVILVGGVSIVVMALGPEAISLFATKEYYEAIWIMPPVAASVFFRFLYPLFSNVEFYFEKKWYVMWASIGGACVNIILNYIFITKFGFIAAGYTTLICYILFALFHYHFYKKIMITSYGKDANAYDIKVLSMVSIVVLIFMILITILYNFCLLRYCFLMFIIMLFIIKRNVIITRLQAIKRKDA